MKVLIIDDDQEDAMLFSDAIEEFLPDALCYRAYNYQSARKIIDSENGLDYIFLDAVMYPVDGKEMLILFSQIEKLAKTAIIIYSGTINESKLKEFVALGADRVLQKPADYNTLTSTIRDILSDDNII